MEFVLVQVTVDEVTVQFQGVPVGTVPNVRPAGSVNDTVTVPLVEPGPLFCSEKFTEPVPPCTMWLFGAGPVWPVVPVPVLGATKVN